MVGGDASRPEPEARATQGGPRRWQALGPNPLRERPGRTSQRSRRSVERAYRPRSRHAEKMIESVRSARGFVAAQNRATLPNLCKCTACKIWWLGMPRVGCGRCPITKVGLSVLTPPLERGGNAVLGTGWYRTVCGFECRRYTVGTKLVPCHYWPATLGC